MSFTFHIPHSTFHIISPSISHEDRTGTNTKNINKEHEMNKESKWQARIKLR